MKLVSDHVVDGRAGPTFPLAWPVLDGIDLTDIWRFRDGQPWADFARMRAEAPVMWHTEPYGHPGFWAVTRYADIRQVNGDPATFSSEVGGILMAMGDKATSHPDLFSANFNSMINLDASPHRQLRREHMPYFTAAYMRQLRAKVADEAARLVEGMVGKQSCDFVGAFASHMPVFTLCEMLGVPEGDREKFVRWIHFLEMAQQMAVEQIDSVRAGGALPPELLAFIELFNTNVSEMFAYGRDMMAKRRAEPQDDLMSAIANAEIDGERLPDEYLDGAWLLIVFAGNDTTRNSLSGAMKLFTEHADQKAWLQGDASLLTNGVHEITRMVSPVIYMRRTATADTEVAGQRIAKGEKVVMYYGAANRDPAVFPDPDRFDIARINADKNIAFGHGPHICIGRLAAQLQLEESCRAIFARFPDIRWTGEIDIAPNNFVHAIRRLEVAFAPAKVARAA